MKNTPLKSGTRDEIEGAVKNLVGKVKEATGKALGNPRLEAAGKIEQVAGKAQGKAGEIKKAFNQ